MQTSWFEELERESFALSKSIATQPVESYSTVKLAEQLGWAGWAGSQIYSFVCPVDAVVIVPIVVDGGGGGGEGGEGFGVFIRHMYT